MRVTMVKATLRYSAETKGAWRSIELGAEAALTNSEEDWRAAQTDLYHRLTQQLKTLWNNGASKERQGQPEPAPPAQVEKLCGEEHQTDEKKGTGASR